jgi:hypothetical protein
MRKYLPVALALLAAGGLGVAPALAQTAYRSAPRPSQQFYMYAPGAMGSVAPDTPAYEPYPNGAQHTGSQENRAQWDPSYVPGAPD